MSILNRPLPPEELPTTRHAHLTDRVTQVLRDAMILPRQMESYDPAVSPETPVEDFNSHTYEDILATAILNKVLESCEGKRPDEVTIEVSHDVASTDTDSGMSGGAKESRRGRHKSEAGSEGSEERSLTPPARHTPAHRPPTASPDQGVVTDECWGPAYAAHDAPLQFKIEEHVEEVTTHHVTDEDEDDDGDASDSGSWRGSRGSLEDRKRTRRHKKVTQHSVTQDPLVSCLPVALPDPNQVTSRRVSFPELGRDIIQDSCSDTECCTVSPSDMVVEADSWEENWLFRRQRLAGVNNSDPITMLIPNPEAHITPTVGNRDVDELSELSEQRSVCSSEPWSDSDGEGEGLYSCSPNAASRELSLLAGEIVAEFGQQDQEYTVDYSAASRMAARRTPPPHSPSYSKPSRPHSLPQHTRHPMEASREHHNGRPVRGTSRDSESVSDTERPVPKPRKLSLATTPSSKASDKSPGKPLSSPMEDLTILSPPLDVPLPSEAKSSSETVWFVETPQDCIVLQGRTLRLSCVLNTKRPMGLTWYHNGSLVQSGGQEVWAWRRGPTHHLHLYNMTPAAAGVYAAAAYTASHCVWAFCRVHYKASARPAKQPTFTKGLTDAAVEECGELTLQCQVQGHPEPRVTFSRGTQQLQPSSRLAIESDQYGTWTLRLSDCALADAGQVTATASNTLASATCRCQVKVFPEGTSLPRQDASRSSRQHQSQSNQQLKGRSGSKPTQRTPHPGPHLSDNTARTPSTAALTTPSHLQLEDSLTTSSGAKSGGGEQEDILQVPTKPGTAPGKPDDLDGALEELHDTIVEETQRSPLLLLSNTASASEASVHEELDAIDSGVGGGGGGSGVGAAAVSVRQSGQGSSKHQHHLFNIAEEASDLAACGGESFPFAPVHGASLDLDYYPSSHDDNTSSSSSSDTDNNEDGKELTLIRPSDYLNSTSSAHQIPQTNLPALPSTLPPNQLHASSSLEDPCLQKHESCPRDSPSSGSPSDAPQTATGTIAEREHRKWEAAVPLPNNPYSPERLAHRLSHTRPPDHAIYTRSSSVEVDLDPSLQDGIPCRADLNRYSRDYYVAGGTNGTAAARSRSNFVNHQKHGQEHSQTFKPQHLTNGCHTPPNTSQQVTRNGQEIRIALGGNQNSVTSKIQNLRDSQGKSEVEAGSLEVVGSCKAVDWKDELKDIQAARVEQEVARLQRTIDEKQRRWETYARHAPGRGISTLSDSSTEHLHHPRSEVYLLPPRHDLWRTVSEDTISVPLREATPQQPLLRHTSMDSLRPTTKVSNIQSLAHQPQQSTTSINSVGSSSIDGQPPNHSTLSHLGRSLESIGGYSDREAMDSDGSHHTPESPALPSVKKLASRFDTGPQKVNNLDKHGKNNSLSHSGKNIHSSGRVPQTDRATYTNNLNKRNEKPYVMKEVRSLAKPSPPPDPDTYSSDNWESDDAETVTSMSLPPTPVSLSNKYSFSTSSLIDTDSSHFDPKDTDTQAPGTFFGVTLRRTNRSSPVHVYSRKRDSTSSESSRADQKEMNLRRLSSTSEASVEQVQGPSSVGRQQTPSSSEEDAPATLRQSTIIKVDQNPRFSFSGHQNSVPFRKYAKSQSLVDLHQPENQSPPPSFSRQQHNSPSVRGYAFAPKGKRSMSNFLRAYTRQKSLHDIHQIDEKAEENFSIQGADDDYIQQRFLDQRKEPASLPTTLRKAKSEKTLTSIGNDSKNPLDLNTIASSKKSQSPKRMYEPTTVNGSTKKEIMHKNTSTTSAPKDSVQASVALVTTPSQEAKASVAVVTTPSQETKPSVAVVTTPSQETKASVAVATTPNQETKASVTVVTTPSQEMKASVAIVTMPSQETNSVEEKIADMEKSVPKVTGHSSEGNKSPLESREDDEHVAATIVYCSGEDPSEIILNEAHVSAFQEHLKKEVQHFSEESSSSDGGQASSRGNTMRRHKSVEDLLKDYSNIKSLDRKKHSAPIVSPKKEPNAESTEPYKTVIAVEHNSTQAPSKIPHTSLTKTSSLTRPKPKPEPMPMKKSLSHSYFKNVNEETKNSQTVISVSGKKLSDDSSDGDVFHASTIYIGGGKSESNPDYSTKITVSGRASPPFKGEITVNDKHVIAPAEPQPLSSVGQHGSMVLKDAKKGERNKDTSDMPDSVITTVEVNDTFIKKERKGKEASDSSHVKVVNVTKKVNHIDYTAEDIEQEDPRILKELIMMESRTGKSGISAKIIARKEKMKDASVPLNSPFSPLRSQSRKKSSSSLSPSEEIPPKLTNQDSQDEGVDFPSDTAPSASSQDPAGPEGDQPRV